MSHNSDSIQHKPIIIILLDNLQVSCTDTDIKIKDTHKTLSTLLIYYC